MAFLGTPEQKAANRATHWFVDGRCADCDCKPFGRVAEWPCGQEPPRVNEPSAGDELVARFIAHAIADGSGS